MKYLPLHELKVKLSSLLSKVAAGESICVTRYRKPYVYISPGETVGLHIGSRVGESELDVREHTATNEAWFDTLQEDRGET